METKKGRLDFDRLTETQKSALDVHTRSLKMLNENTIDEFTDDELDDALTKFYEFYVDSFDRDEDLLEHFGYYDDHTSNIEYYIDDLLGTDSIDGHNIKLDEDGMMHLFKNSKLSRGF